MMNAGQMSYIDSLMLFSAGAWATVRITRDGVFTHKRFTHTDAFAHRSFYTQKFLHREVFAHTNF